MIQNRKSALLDSAARPVVELLENRQLLSATLSVNTALMVFNAVAGSGTPSQTETLTLTNIGDAPLTLGSGGITFANEGGGSIPFSELNASSIPASLAPGQSFGLQLNYTATAVQTDSALLDISTNDPVNAVAQVTLHGIGTKGLGGSNQPSLATILQAYDIPTLVGDGPNDANALTDNVYPYPPDPSSQEVVLQRFVKAGAGPVTIQALASFTASGTKPYTLGTYVPGDPTQRTELFFTPSSESQSTYIQPQGTTSFDPGTSQFGFYCVSNVQTSGRLIYSEDSLNTFDSTTGRHFRFFPMENPDGSVQPNAYIMTSTEWNAPIGYDFTNIVAIVRNVKAANGAPDGPVMGLQDLNALPDSSNMIFSRIESPNTSIGDIVHDTGTLQVNNTGDAPLTINSYTLSGGWKLVSPPTFPVTVAAESKLDLTIQFVATGEPSHPYNETNGTPYGDGGGVYDGTITLNGNDPNTPTASYNLRGWWQLHSENENEPSLQSIVNLLAGYTTEINPTPIPDLTESVATGATPTYYGQEVVSAYWTEADTGIPVNITQVDSYHTEGTSVVTYWYAKGSGSSNKLFSTVADMGQTLLPDLLGTTTPASGSFSSTGTFGFRIDNEYSDDSKNAFKSGGGHHVRFYPLIDANGNLVPNTYIMALDYSASPENFDFQDNVYIIRNIKPAVVNTGISLPQTTGAPSTPTDLGALSSNGVNTLQWGPVLDTNVVGYNVYSAAAQAGPYTLLTPTPINAITYTDIDAIHTGTSYYKVTAITAAGNESLGVQASVVNTGSTAPGAPVAAPVNISTPFQTAVVIGVAADATDNANGTILPSTVAIAAPAGHGTTSVDPTTGAITYTPSTGYSGTDTFQYTIGDNTGATSAPATVTVDVNPMVIGLPVAANLSYTALQGVALNIPDAASATDSTGTIDPTTVAITQGPSHGTATVDHVTGDITYTATVGYNGPDSIKYTIGDNLGAVSPVGTLSLTVAPIGPVVPASTSAVASANNVNTINVISSATDASGNIGPSGVAITTAPVHGTASVDPSTGMVIYTPTAGYFGTDSLQYTLTDNNHAVSSVGTLAINVGVAINNTNAKSLSFVDNLGSKVTVALTGGGTGEVFFNGTGTAQSIGGPHGSVVVSGTGLSISDITVNGTTMTGALIITRKGSASVELGDLSVAGAIGKIIAPTTTLTGTLAITGAITQLQLASASGATITVGSAQATRAGFSFTSGHVVNTSLTSTAPIKSIKVIDWTVSDATDSITAPSIASLVTTGNFQASVTTTGGSPFAMASARIGGQIDAEAWNITGLTNNLVIGSVAPGWVGTFNQPLNSFTIRGGGFAGTLNATAINNLSITGDDTGKITAGSIKSARINGQLSGATITVTNPVAPKVTSLGRLSVTGQTLNSKVISAGNIGVITMAGIATSSIDAGTAAGVTLPTAASSFSASATISSFSVVGAGSRFTNSNIGAELIGSLNLGTITTANKGHAFGVGASTIKSLSATLDIGGVLHMNAAALQSPASIMAYLGANSISLGDFAITPGL